MLIDQPQHLKRAWLSLVIIDLIWVTVLFLYPSNQPHKTSLACLTLVNSEQKTYYQWSSDTDHPPFTKGQWRWNERPPLGIPFPELKRQQESNVTIHRLSQGKLPDQYPLILLYDDWDKRTLLEHPLRPAPDTSLNTVLFLDHSATMNNPWHNSHQSAWEISLQQLVKKRKLHAENWEIITFGSHWTVHGHWQAGKNFALQSFGQPKGKTKWSEALEAWLLTQPSPSHLIMIGDGKIEERNLQLLKKTLETTKSQGHQISVLSPELKALDAWKQLYQSQLVSSDWTHSNTSSISKKIISQHPVSCEWSQVTKAISGKNHLPLVWSNEGYLLMSCELREQGALYHLAGMPTIDPAQLLKQLHKVQQQPIFVEIHATHLICDFQSDSKAPLTLQSPQGTELIWPEQWGIYKIPQKSNQMTLSHPQYGIVQIKHAMDFQNKVFTQTFKSKPVPLTHSGYGATFNFILALIHLALLVFTALNLRKQHDRN